MMIIASQISLTGDNLHLCIGFRLVSPLNSKFIMQNYVVSEMLFLPVTEILKSPAVCIV